MNTTRKLFWGLFLGFLCILTFLSFQALSSSAATSAALRKGPYLLINGDSSSMTVLWQTNKTPGNSRVDWGISPGNYSSSSGNVAETGDHQFSYRISGLGPQARIYYRVTVDNTQSAGTFVTAPSLSATTLTFYGYGDTRGGLDLLSSSQYVIHSYLEREIMKDVGRDPLSHQTFALHLGDFVDCGLDENYWDGQYFNRNLIYSQQFLANLPVLGTIGNHESFLPGHSSGNYSNCEPLKPGKIPNCEIEDATNAGALFYKYFPYKFYPFAKGPGDFRDYFYCFDYGPARFFALDCINSFLAVNSPQYLWLSKNISPSRLWNIVSIHVPLWASKSNHGESEPRGLRQSLEPLFEAKDIPLVVQGHEHYYSRCLVNGITYLTLAGGGANLYDPAPYDSESLPYVVNAAKAYHFARFEISGSGMSVTVIDKDGIIIDFFKILPPAINIWPSGGASAGLAPVLISSRFSSQDGAAHQSSQWIIRDFATGQIVYITNDHGVPFFDKKNLTSLRVPAGILRFGQKYKWQVIYKDTNGNTSRPSLATPFIARDSYIFNVAKRFVLRSAFNF